MASQSDKKKREKKTGKAAKKSSSKGRKSASSARKPTSKAAKKKTTKKAVPKKKAAKKALPKKKATAKKATKKKSAKKTAPKKSAKKAAPKKRAAPKKAAGTKKPAGVKPFPGEAAGAVPESPVDVVLVAPHSTIEGTEPHAVSAPGSVVAVHSTKYEVTPPDRIVEPVYPGEPMTKLPAEYGETRLVLMVRDPQWLFLYWEISPSDREMLDLTPESLAERLVVRLHDVTGIDEFNGLNSTRWYEIPITGGAVSWYVNLPESNREWCAELGVLNEQGEFIQICRSNKAHTPPDFIAEEMDAEWMAVSEELREIIARSADMAVVGSHQIGSEEAIRQISRRLRLALESREGASAAVSGSLRVRPLRVHARGEGGRDLALSVRTELIVSGSTDPQASLTVGGEAVDLRPDGSFTLRFELPDGRRSIAVRAQTSDGELSRQITPIVEKETR